MKTDDYDALPLITIIIPCYNQGKYLEEAIDSVLAQTYPNWECIIVDDGSTDNSPLIAHKYAEASSGRVRLAQQANAGPSAARNKGARLTTSKYLLFLDGDDKLAPEYVESGIRHMESHPTCALFYSRVEYFGGESGEWPLHYTSYKDLLFNNSIDCCCIVRRIDFERIGGFDEQLYGYEDWEFFIRLLYNNDEVQQDSRILFYYRKGVNDSSVNQRAKARQEELTNYIFEKNRDIFTSLYGSPHQAYFNAWLYKKELDKILNSKTYTLAKKLTLPLRWGKKYLAKK